MSDGFVDDPGDPSIPARSVYDGVTRKYLVWRYGMPSEVVDWLMEQEPAYNSVAEAREISRFIVDECMD